MVNTVLMKLHLVSQPIDWLGPKHAMLTVILVAVWGAVGNYMLLFLAGLQSIPQDLYESAAMDGANAGRRFWSITLPMLAPVAQMVIMLAIIASLKGYESIMVITEGGPIGKPRSCISICTNCCSRYLRVHPLRSSLDTAVP
ncbi:hypothetical protein HMSSN036_01770 [Paenibacillus macerans]|nr:hypothetical protein HMSSN036_01770 [Paenibacillus macerans]